MSESSSGAQAGSVASGGARWRGYAFAVVTVSVFTALGFASRDVLAAKDVGMLLLLAVVAVAYREPRGPALVAVGLSVASFDFFFVLPYYTLAVNNTEFLVSFAAFAVVGVTISGLTARVKENERAAHEARFAAEAERMRNALLSSVSHDLRTPLGSIIGSVSTLRDQPLDAAGRLEMLETIREEAEYLESLLDNLLQMTRVEGGGAVVRQEWQLPEEIVGAALRRLEGALDRRRVRIEIDPGVGLARFDGMLVELALVNLLDNAVKYSEPETPVEVLVSRSGGEVLWRVLDRGVGVPPGEELRVFEKFYRVPGRHERGSGLGLAIARAIVLAHGGRIWAGPREDGLAGAAFGFALPRGEQPPELPSEELA